MRIKFSHIAPLLATGAAAVAIIAAPTAAAATAPTPAPAAHACTNGVCPNTHSTLPPGELPGRTWTRRGAKARTKLRRPV